MRKHLPTLSLLMLGLVSASTGISQTNANLVLHDDDSPTAPMPPREYHAATQLGNGQTLVWGGEDPGRSLYFQDGYLFDAAGVARIDVPPNTPVPSGRRAPGFTYIPPGDNSPGAALLFGGHNETGLLADTWIMDLATSTWSEIPTPGPSPRAESHVVWHHQTKKAILFGGMADLNYTSFHGDTWEFDPLTNTWQELQIAGPPARSDGGMLSVPGAGVMLHAGADTGYMNDTWLFDGVQWTQQFPSNPPPGRFGHATYFDESRDQVVVYGGVVPPGMVVNELWVLHEGGWIRSDTTGPLRVGATGTYDPNRESGLLTGGTDWLMTYGDARRISSESPATIDPFGTGCAGSNGVPTIGAAPGSRPWIDDKVEVELSGLPLPGGPVFVAFGDSKEKWDVNPLPLDLSPIGLTNCFAHASVDIAFPVASSGGVALWELEVPNFPGLVGESFFLQVVAFDPGINPAGAVVGNALELEVGVR